MAVCPTNFDEKVECPFVDRKEFIETFENAFQNISQRDYSVLVYYGVAGIGKTSLRKKLPALLEKHNESDRHMRVIWTSIDFATEQYRQPYKFLEVLSSQLRQKYGIKFNSFDIALATYWKKVNPRVPLVKENYSEESIVRDVLDICDEFVPANLIPNVLNLARNLPERYQKWALKRKEEISRLPNLEPADIDELLPVFWAYDLADHLQNSSESAVIFIDTYEALWEKEREKGSFNFRDEWIRKIVANLPKSTLWVICGREALRWGEVDEDWKNHLDQHILGKLPEKYAINLLEQCGITEKDIHKVLIESSEGVPYYLELSIDTYRKIKKRKQPAPEDFAKVPDEIFCRFVKYLDREEKETLKVLSTPRYWDRELFEILVEKFKTEYPETSFSELHSFSFITFDDNGKCSMHQLMRKSLQEYQDHELKKEVHFFMCIYYSLKIKDLNIKAINLEHEIALNEAFYHAKETFKAEELYEWFIEYSTPFYNATFWNLLYPLYEEMLQILNEETTKCHPLIANISINLGSIFFNMGKVEKAKQNYESAQRIYEKLIEEEPEKEINYLKAGKILTHLGVLLRSQGNLTEARIKIADALEIYWDLGKRTSENEIYFSDLGEALSCLGNILADSGEQKKAEECYKDTTKIYNYLLEKSPNNVVYLSNVGLLYNNLGTLFLDTWRLDEATNMLENSFKNYDKLLNEDPKNSMYENCLGGILNNLGASLYCSNKPYEAKQKYENALKIRMKLYENAPENSIYKLNLIETLDNLGNVLVDLKQLEESEKMYKKSLQILDELMKWQPNDPNCRFYLGAAFKGYGYLISQKSQLKEAEQNYRKAIEIYEKLVTEYPLNAKYQLNLGKALNSLGNLFFEMERYNEALLHYKLSLCYVGSSVGKSHQYFKKIESNIKNTSKIL